MRAWTRLTDWIIIAGGLVAAFSPSMIPTTPSSAGALALLGSLLVLGAVINLAAPRVTFIYWILALLGLLLFIAPWPLDMMDNIATSFVAWIVGAVCFVLALGAAIRGRKAHEETSDQRAA